jgi:hypothetical protein
MTAGGASGPTGGIGRREMLAALARWSVPTVVTIALTPRILHAKASCPPCQRQTGGTCRACTTGQILNCNCEPCLGPPYCSAVGPSAPATPFAQPSVSATPDAARRQELSRALQDARREGARQSLYADPFNTAPARAYPDTRPLGPGLFDRLRSDSVPAAGRRP